MTGMRGQHHRNIQEKKAKYGCRLSLENFAEYENIKVYPLDAFANILD